MWTGAEFDISIPVVYSFFLIGWPTRDTWRLGCQLSTCGIQEHFSHVANDQKGFGPIDAHVVTSLPP